MNDSKGTGTITDRKEWGQRDQDRRTGKREIHRHKTGTWTKTGEQGQRDRKIERDTGTERGIEGQ